MADRNGQQPGNYKLIRLLGEGGFAEVYLGEHIHLGTEDAIKVLHTQLTSDDRDSCLYVSRTNSREAETSKRSILVSHRCVCRSFSRSSCVTSSIVLQPI